MVWLYVSIIFCLALTVASCQKQSATSWSPHSITHLLTYTLTHSLTSSLTPCVRKLKISVNIDPKTLKHGR